MRSVRTALLALSSALHRPVSASMWRHSKVVQGYVRRSAYSKSSAPSRDNPRTFETLRSTGHKETKKKAKLVIFDKDGTLICFHTMWSPWAQKFIANIVSTTGLDIGEKLSTTIGYCAQSKRVFPGLLAEATTQIVQAALVETLVAEGIEKERAVRIIRDAYEDGDTGNPDTVKSVANLKTLFEILKRKDIKIAVCTSDNRRGTLNTLRNLKLDKYVDMVVCGDDPNTHPKPSPHNAWKICGHLGVEPESAVMVGDTKADVGMGSAAKLGWTVGVLSGVGATQDLLPEAQHIICSVQDLLPLILPYEDWKDCYAYTTDGRILLAREEEEEVQEGGMEEVRLPNVQLVIFDLQGTLGSIHSKHADWLEHLTDRLEKLTGLQLADKIYTSFGVDKGTKQVKAGLMATATYMRLRSELVKILREAGLLYEEAIMTVNLAWQESAKTLNDAAPELINENVVKVLRCLRKSGIKIAVNTTTGREMAVRDLSQLGLLKYAHMVVCGDDDPSFSQGKSPQVVKLICDELGCLPEKTVIVGDTMADINMGLEAGVGLTIGVLSGVGSYAELVQADRILPSAGDILSLVHEDVFSDSDIDDKNQNNSSSGHAKKGGSLAQGARHFSTLVSHWATGVQQQRFYSVEAKRTAVKETLPNVKVGSSVPDYDYIIVGAGSAGCVLAHRLSKDPDNKVLLIEAGPEDKSWKIEMPAALMYNLCDDRYNWYYHTDPEPGMNNRVMYWPRGRVWGGSSSLNAMVYVRGHAYDYDRWEKEGASHWSYADCLPYFRKSQTHELGPDEYRGGDGALQVSRGKTDHPLHKAFIQAGMEAGYPFTDDMNGCQQEGMGWMDMTIGQGKRCSAASAYLRPVLYRKNLVVLSRAMASRILFDGKRAVGLEYWQGGQAHKARARQEVILCGGAINSPQLLMLSGVGDARDLRQVDIPVVADLPGVGQNLQDHLEVYVQHACTQPITLYSAQWKFPHHMIRIGLEWFINRTGYGATAHLESGAFIRSRAGVEHPDIQFHFLPSTVVDHGRKTGPCHAYQVHVYPTRPTSRGYVKLRSRDPNQHPKIVANYLSTEQDVQEMRNCVKLSREIFAQKAFDPFRGVEIAPGPKVSSDKDIDQFIRAKADSGYHPSCTCKMGSVKDAMAVVDAQTQVIGLQGLRVVDASIMPSMVSGNLNGPTIMLAEKAADIILGNPPLPKSSAPVWKPKSLDSQR